MDINDTEIEKVVHTHQTLWRPCQGGKGCPMSPDWILKRFVSVFITACCLLSALPSLSQFGRGRLSVVAISFHALSLLFRPCRLSEFTLIGFAKLNPSPHSWIFTSISVDDFQSSLLFIHFHHGPANTHSHCTKVWHRSYCDAPLSRLCSIQKSCQNHHSYVWTEAPHLVWFSCQRKSYPV